MAVKRIIVAESGGPTPVIDWEVAGALAAAQKHGIEVFGAMNGIEGMIYANVPGNIVDLTKANPMEFVYNGPGAGLRTTRNGPKEHDFKGAMKVGVRNLVELGVDGMAYIGGNDSAEVLDQVRENAQELKDLGELLLNSILGIHAIKTVDNDLPGTHHSPGWASMSLFNAAAIKYVQSDFSSYRLIGNVYGPDGNILTGQVLNAPVLIYQVMGRKCGYGAIGTTFAKMDPMGQIDPDKPPHIVLNQEHIFEQREFLDAVEQAITSYGECVIAVQEDLTDRNGKSLAVLYADKNAQIDAHGNIQHGRADSFSVAIFLSQLIQKNLGQASRITKLKDTVIVPQHLQRSYALSMVDASEAYMIGYAAVEALVAGETGKSVILQKTGSGQMTTALQDLSVIAGKASTVPAEYFTPLRGGTQAFVDEFVYLIGGPCAIPHFARPRFPAVTIPASITAAPYAKPPKK